MIGGGKCLALLALVMACAGAANKEQEQSPGMVQGHELTGGPKEVPVARLASNPDPPGFSLPTFGMRVSWRGDQKPKPQPGKGDKEKVEAKKEADKGKEDRKEKPAPKEPAGSKEDTKPEAKTPDPKKPAEPKKPEAKKPAEPKNPEAKKPAEPQKGPASKKGDPKEDNKKPTPTKNAPSPKKRSPLPTKYTVGNNAGIKGVGGGSLPDSGFVLEPSDIYQRAINSAHALEPRLLTTAMAIVMLAAVIF